MIQTIFQGARGAAVRAGLSRGWIETRQSFAGGGIVMYLFFPVIYAGVLLFMRGETVPGTDFSLGAMVLPGILGMSIAFGGLMGPAGAITMDRDDGTLLRAKATPNGMDGYLVGKIVMFALTSIIALFVMVIPASLVAGDLVFDARTWLILVLIFVGGMLATVPLSVTLGSVFKDTSQSGILFMVSIPLISTSGIFYPITAMPVWLQWFGQAFPFYWLGLGARAAMLPANMVAAEIGQSWRFVEMFAVLGLWTVVGLVFAPIFLRRMARRQSGSTVAKARERYMNRGY